MDIYVVRDGYTIVGISARLQGAELLRNERAAQLADKLHHGDHSGPWQRSNQIIYDRMTIENHELQDA